MKDKLKGKLEEIKQLVSEGKTNKEIASIFNVSAVAIKKQLDKIGIKPNKKYEKFSDQVVSEMKLMFSAGSNCIHIADYFGTTQSRVLKVLNDSGVDTSSKFFKGDKAELAISMYDSGKTQEDIARYFGCERQAVQTLFKSVGKVGRTQLEQKQIAWYIDQSCFTDWCRTQDLYFYGLLLSDGCLKTGTDSVIISLQEQDADILFKFKEYLKIDNKLQTIIGKPTVSNKVTLSFRDKIVANNLRRVGFDSKKSCNEIPPKFLGNIELDKHFWRGYIDGDGCVKIYNTPFLHVCGGMDICQSFINFCNKVLGYDSGMKPHKHMKKGKFNGLYYTRVSGRKARDIAYFMYNGNEYYSIKRKYSVAMKMQEWQPKPSSKVYGVYKRGDKFRVYIMKDGKQVSGGMFDTEEAAINFRLNWELEYFGYYKSEQ